MGRLWSPRFRSRPPNLYWVEGHPTTRLLEKWTEIRCFFNIERKEPDTPSLASAEPGKSNL